MLLKRVNSDIFNFFKLFIERDSRVEWLENWETFVCCALSIVYYTYYDANNLSKDIF